MLPIIIGTIVLAMIYGLFWHNQPANERNRAGDDDNHNNEFRAALGVRRSRTTARRRLLPERKIARDEGDTTHVNASTDESKAQAKEPIQ